MATPPKKNPQQTAKAQRAEQRAAQLAALKKREAIAKRNRLLAIIGSVIAVVAIVAGVTTVFVLENQPQPPADTSGDYTERVQLYPDLPADHVTGTVGYDVEPPVGGPHNPTWLQCGIYDREQTNENAVHDLEHGAIWLTYDPGLTADADVEALRELARERGSYMLVSPYPGIGQSMAASAWGAQLRFDDPADPVLAEFIENHWRSADSPEPMATCDSPLIGPGRIQ
ncbi:DUF3105 domain-containing protein [Pseudolysinimonas sp.]